MGRDGIIEDYFHIKEWEVLVLYQCTCYDTDYIIETLKDINCPYKYIKEAIHNLDTCNLNIGLTYSNLDLKSSVIIISKTSSFELLINTVAHEYYHLICHISKSLKIKDEEELANLNGNLNMRSYKIIENFKEESGF